MWAVKFIGPGRVDFENTGSGRADSKISDGPGRADFKMSGPGRAEFKMVYGPGRDDFNF